MKNISLSKVRMSNWGFDYSDMTIGNMFRKQSEIHGDREFLHFLEDGRRYSWKDMDRLSNCLANGLVKAGVAAGEHVAVVMTNCPEQILSYLALGKIGAVSVPINSSARGKVLSHQLNYSDSKWVIAESLLVDRILEVDAPLLQKIFVLGDSTNSEGRLDSFLALLDSPDSEPDVVVKFSDLAMLMFTSGTTGPSKANMYVHATVVQMGMSTAQTYGYRFDDVLYVALPLNHVNAYVCTTWGSIIAGASVALSRKFSVSRYWSEIRSSNATGTHMLSSMVNMLWNQPVAITDAENALRFMVLTPMPSFALKWEKRFGVRVIMSYGLSDYAMATSFNMLDPVSKLGSAGRPRPGIELRVVDAQDLDVPENESGEIVLRSNNPWGISMGYYKNPEATAAATRNLWWHTGDYGYLDEDGYLFFIERKKEAIRRRGENISAFEVESVLLDLPQVAEAAVFGLPSELGDEEVCAAIQLIDGATLNEADLVAYCMEHMAIYMVPRYVQFLTQFPRTDTFKIQKEELRRKAMESLSSLWDREIMSPSRSSSLT